MLPRECDRQRPSHSSADMLTTPPFVEPLDGGQLDLEAEPIEVGLDRLRNAQVEDGRT